MLRSFVAVLVLAVAPVAIRAADEENPYKNAKLGDYALYTVKAAGGAIDGTLTQTVTAKSDKEVTVKGSLVFSFGGKEQKVDIPEEKIDLTKPYDPSKSGGAALPGGGGEIKAEKDKDGKEKIKVGGKEYDTTWYSYKVKLKVMGQEIPGEMKAWVAKDMPLGMVKMVMTLEAGGQKIEAVTELKETGNKK